MNPMSNRSRQRYDPEIYAHESPDRADRRAAKWFEDIRAFRDSTQVGEPLRHGLDRHGQFMHDASQGRNAVHSESPEDLRECEHPAAQSIAESRESLGKDVPKDSSEELSRTTLKHLRNASKSDISEKGLEQAPLLEGYADTEERSGGMTERKAMNRVPSRPTGSELSGRRLAPAGVELTRGVQPENFEELVQDLLDMDLENLQSQTLAYQEVQRWEPKLDQASTYLDALKRVLEIYWKSHVEAVKKSGKDPKQAIAVGDSGSLEDADQHSFAQERLIFQMLWELLDRRFQEGCAFLENSRALQTPVAGSSRDMVSEVVWKAQRLETPGPQENAVGAPDEIGSQHGAETALEAYNVLVAQPTSHYDHMHSLHETSVPEVKHSASDSKMRPISIARLGKKIARHVARPFNGGHSSNKGEPAIADQAAGVAHDIQPKRDFQSKREGKRPARPLESVEGSSDLSLPLNELTTTVEISRKMAKTQQDPGDILLWARGISRTASILRERLSEQDEVQDLMVIGKLLSESDTAENMSSPEEVDDSILVECVCCGDTKPMKNNFSRHRPTSACQHAVQTCRDCMERWLAHELEEKGSRTMHCPECREVMNYEDVKRGASETTRERYDRRLFHLSLSEDPDFAWCLVGLPRVRGDVVVLT